MYERRDKILFHNVSRTIRTIPGPWNRFRGICLCGLQTRTDGFVTLEPGGICPELRIVDGLDDAIGAPGFVAHGLSQPPIERRISARGDTRALLRLFDAEAIEPLGSVSGVGDELSSAVAVDCLQRLPKRICQQVFEFNKVVSGRNCIDEKSESAIIASGTGDDGIGDGRDTLILGDGDVINEPAIAPDACVAGEAPTKLNVLSGGKARQVHRCVQPAAGVGRPGTTTAKRTAHTEYSGVVAIEGKGAAGRQDIDKALGPDSDFKNSAIETRLDIERVTKSQLSAVSRDRDGR